MRRRISICLLLGAAALSAADKPNREVQELQRDVAQLQELVKGLQQALEGRFTAMASQLQSMTESGARVNTTVAGLQKAIEQLAQDQDRKIVPLIAAQGSRLDQEQGTLSTMQQSFADLTAAINRLQTQIVDLGNAVKVIQSPAPKPPSAEELLRSADSDRLGGKAELALQEYAEFLKSYGDAPVADTAQYQLGMLHYAQKDFEAAVTDFDTLARSYPKSKRVAEALFYQFKSLQALNRPVEARAACQTLRQKFPASDFARQCVAPRQ